MRRQFHNVRSYVHDKVQDINHSSRALSSNVISSISALGRKEDKEENRIFGLPLSQHLKNTDREISVVIESCVAFLLEFLEEEGLFRIPGALAEVKRLKSGFEAGLSDLTDRVRDPHAVAGTLKSYLRELPEPLLSHSLYAQWIDASQVSDPQERLHALHRVCQDLPPENFVNLRYLIKFLDKLVSHSDVNKMSSQNIAMAITPSLMWTPGVAGEDATAMHMTATNLHSVIVYNLISHAQFFFPDDVNFTSLLTFAINEANRCALRATHPDSGSSVAVQPQPKVTPRKAPKKPAPPVPGVLFRCSSREDADVICVNNNNEKGVNSAVLRDTNRLTRLSTASSHSSSEALCSSSPAQSCFDTTSLDRKGIIRRNSDKAGTARKAFNRKSALSLQRPTVPPPERPGSAIISGSLLRQRSVDDLLKGSPLAVGEMTRSTEVLSSQKSSGSTGNQSLKTRVKMRSNNVTLPAKDDEGDCDMGSSMKSESGLFHPHNHKSQDDDHSPSGCCLKSFKRLDSPVESGPDITQSLETNSFQQDNEVAVMGQESGVSSPAPPIPPQPQAPKKPPRRAKSRNSHSHHAYSASPSPDQTTVPNQESAAIVENHANEETSDGLAIMIQTLNQSIDSLERSESGEELLQTADQAPAKPPRKSRSREDLADRDSVVENVCGTEDKASETSAEAKAKPRKPAPPPKPRMAVPSSTSSYL